LSERELAEINFRTGYAALILAFRARAHERRIAITSPDVAEVADLASYYIPKLLSPSKNPVRRVGINSLGPLPAILGAKLVLKEDPEAVRLYGDRIPQRDESCVRVLAVKAGRGKHQWVPLRLLRKIAPLGAVARNRSLSPARRSQIARHAANIRWARRKARKAEAA
jgi:hypothetical protein